MEDIFFEHKFHKLIDIIYSVSAAETDSYYPFLKEFVAIFSGHSASFSIYDIDNKRVLGFWAIGMTDASIKFYSDYVAHQDILLETAHRAYQNGSHRFVSTNLDLGNYTPERRLETRADEWLNSYGAKEAAGAIVYKNNSYVTLFAMQRSAHQKEFTHEELNLYNKFLPHLKRSVKAYIEKNSTNTDKSYEQQALEMINRGVIIFDQSFKAVYYNNKAEKNIFKEGILKVDQNGSLTTRKKQDQKKLVLSISKAMEASIERREIAEDTIKITHNNTNHILAIKPLTLSADDANKSPGVLIIHYSWSNDELLNIDILKKLFDLTPTEAKIATGLTSGLSITDIAKMQFRSRDTIKFHLNNIFRKTNTERQGELIALLARSCIPP